MPFDNHRFSWNVLYVADPFFSIAPFISFLFLLVLNKAHQRRVAWIRSGLFVSAFYLCLAVLNKQIVNRDIRASLEAQGRPAEFFSTPSPFNSLLWFVASRDSGMYHTTYQSVFDKGPASFRSFSRNDAGIDTITNQKDLRLLLDFAQGYYTFEHWGDTTVLNVLRFGQVVGWYNPQEKFAFHYFLNHPKENDLVVQRGRFQRWNRQSIGAFFRRMLGKQ
jgi:inner membrane protein